MIERLKRMLAEGKDCRIFTARVAPIYLINSTCDEVDQVIKVVIPTINAWCREHVGQLLPVTAVKDYNLLELYDDRCVQVQTNTGAVFAERLRVADQLLDDAAKLVTSIQAQKDGAYLERDKCVALIARICHAFGGFWDGSKGEYVRSRYDAWLGRHVGEEWEDDWRNIVFVRIPTGQLSWHIHDSELPMFAFLPVRAPLKLSCDPEDDRLIPLASRWAWDGHTTEEKYRRILEFVRK